MTAHKRRGITLIELLVVIFIIGLLIALLLPAVQAARESGRRVTCQSHLKQLGAAMLNHESAERRLPSGGWGFAWVGDPDRGTDQSQPGGWTYNLLPYIEQENIAQIGKSKPFSQKKDDLTAVVQIPVAIFNCPSRRSLELSEFSPFPPPVNFNVVPAVAQTDYAVNAGDYDVGGGPGPSSLAQGDDPNYPWHDTSKADGVCYLRSMVTLAEIRDGLSHTYLVGEKYFNRAFDAGDDQSMYSGYDYDGYRWTKPNSPPLRDGKVSAPDRFGSAHATACHFVFCDGSVRPIRYEINPAVHQRLGNRADGLAIDNSQF
ncbi:MAG TPA: DUF1559 domain-containing protein [Pirellulales bacterium]|nr:DUF1559 domain-containing protein [Pirellulales bacterium]